MSGFTAGFRARNAVAATRLAEHTTMRIGGAAEHVEFNHRADLPELLGRPRRWLGKGANLLVGDDGLTEPVVTLGPEFARLEVGALHGGRATVRAGAGLDLARLMSATIAAGLAGPEGLAGVPASVGGALRMNAGTSTCWMLDWVSRVEVVLPGEEAPRWLERAELPASYRSCGLGEGVLFLGCELELAGDDPARLKATATRLKQAKAASQPLAARSAGCVFKNPSRELPAGRLIDELGLKGSRMGAAVVSPVHANFIVNDGGATAADVAALVRLIRGRAWRERGVVLQMEVETWNCPADLRVHPREYEGVEV
jgi:UDP-N-acetylmuramate dehydrogenase